MVWTSHWLAYPFNDRQIGLKLLVKTGRGDCTSLVYKAMGEAGPLILLFIWSPSESAMPRWRFLLPGDPKAQSLLCTLVISPGRVAVSASRMSLRVRVAFALSLSHSRLPFRSKSPGCLDTSLRPSLMIPVVDLATPCTSPHGVWLSPLQTLSRRGNWTPVSVEPPTPLSQAFSPFW